MIKTAMNATGLKTVKGQLERLRRDGNFTAKQIRAQCAKELVKELRKTAPKDTGEYSKSIQIKSNRKTRSVIGPTRKRNITIHDYITQGTKPHPIVPVKAKALHWVDKHTGQHHFSQYVWHPGTAKNDYMKKALKKILPKAFRNSLAGITKKHAWLRK